MALLGLYSVTGTAQDTTPRLSFQIETGPSGGTYFPVGQAIAGIISHPPGASRCDVQDACGPTGLIATASTSAGAVENVADVNAHRADAALAQSDVVAEAIAGKGPFRRAGPQTHVRTLAVLFPEDVLLVALKASRIRELGDLQGKRVSLGAPGSGTAATARAILAVCHLSSRVKSSADSADIAAGMLERGKIDALFFVGGSPVPFVQDLVSRGKISLVPIEGDYRKKVVSQLRGLSAAVIASGAYAGQGATQTVATHATLIVNDSESSDIVYGVVRALFNPANRSLLDASHESARSIRLETAASGAPAPLHTAAARFYADAANGTRSIVKRR